MGGSPKKKQQRPSYEIGRLRDKSLEKKIDPKYGPKDLTRLLAQSVASKRPSNRSKPKASES